MGISQGNFMVEVNSVSAKYRKTVLTDVNLKANEGECIGLLGLNGSGKSTLLSCIAGIKKPHSGSIRAEGKVGFVTQENELIDELNAIDNIMMWTSMKRGEILKELEGPELSILKVKDFANVKVKNMSGGMKKRVALTSILITKPDILLLDEPLAALDIPAKKDILKIIDSFTSNGGTVIVASHEEEMFAHCSTVYYLDKGKATLLPKDASISEVINA